MTISELITALENIRKTHGDIGAFAVKIISVGKTSAKMPITGADCDDLDETNKTCILWCEK